MRLPPFSPWKQRRAYLREEAQPVVQLVTRGLGRVRQVVDDEVLHVEEVAAVLLLAQRRRHAPHRVRSLRVPPSAEPRE